MQIPVFFTAKSTFYVNRRQPPLPRSVKPPLARGSGIIPFVPVRPLVMPRRTEFALRNSALRQNYGAYRAAPSQMGPLRRGFGGAFLLLNHLVQALQRIRQPADAVNQTQLHRLLSHTRPSALCGDPFFSCSGELNSPCAILHSGRITALIAPPHRRWGPYGEDSAELFCSSIIWCRLSSASASPPMRSIRPSSTASSP